jgi:hypothetical protein
MGWLERPVRWRDPLPSALLVLTFAFTLFIRVRGVTTNFWMLWDQIRDWEIALRPFGDLPLVGPPTHFRGYTIGPAFYWILWAIRVTIGPWFDNLPHAGGIGHAVLQSAADSLLLAAVWHRTRSLLVALTAVVLLATSAYDLCLAPLVWNPVMGSILARTATALVLLEWHRRSAVRAGVTAAVAWSAVHAYTGAVYVAAGVFLAMMVEPLARRDWRVLRTTAVAIAVSVAALQLPYVVRQLSRATADPIMGAVTGSVVEVATGREPPQIAKSVAGYTGAFSFIQGFPSSLPAPGWILLFGSVSVAIVYRRDPALLALMLAPQALAVVGYSIFLGGLDNYYYLSLMPAAVLTTLLALTAMPWPRVRHAVALAALAFAVSQAPGRLQYSASMHKMPEYGPLVEGSRKIARLDQPMRHIDTEFTLPQPSDSTFVFRILGGRLDPASPWTARIAANGDVAYTTDR